MYSPVTLRLAPIVPAVQLACSCACSLLRSPPFSLFPPSPSPVAQTRPSTSVPLTPSLPAESSTPLREIILTGSKATVALWAPLSDHIITGHESGKIAKYDTKTGEEVMVVEESHRGEITDIQLSPDGTYFITSSKDKTARVSAVRCGVMGSGSGLV